MKKRLLSPALRGNFLLLLAAFIWGVAFVAQKEGGTAVGDLTFNGVRSFIGGTVLLIAIPVLRLFGFVHLPTSAKQWKDTLLGGALCGIALFLATNLQQIGISHTTVGKSGFITALYIVLVPLFGLAIGRRTTLFTWLGVALAVAGLYLLCMQGESGLDRGDLLVIDPNRYTVLFGKADGTYEVTETTVAQTDYLTTVLLDPEGEYGYNDVIDELTDRFGDMPKTVKRLLDVALMRAIAEGIKILGFSDHAPIPYTNGYKSGIRMTPDETDGYFSSIISLREKYADKIAIHIGFEAEYYEPVFSMSLELWKKYPVEYLLLGQHFIGPEYKIPQHTAPRRTTEKEHLA